MMLFKFELNKLLIKQKAILIIFAFIIVKIIFLFLSPLSNDLVIERNKANYNHYMNTLSGKLTDEKRNYIQEEKKKLEDTRILTDNLLSNSERGEITEEEFVIEMKKNQEILQREKAFKIILNDLNYIEKNNENRYFLYKTGWNELIAKENIDVTLVLLLLAIIVPFFANEYEKGTNLVIIPSKKGMRQVVVIKSLISILIAVLLTCTFAAIEYVFYDIKYGLPSGDYPLQTLSFFETSIRNVSLIKTFFICNIVKCAGYIMLVFISMLLSIKLKHSVPAAFFSLCTLIIPYFIFKVGELKYKLPGPLGNILATGYFIGDRTIDNTLIFKSLTLIDLIFVCITNMTILLLIHLLILKYYSNLRIFANKKNRSANL